MAESDPVGRFLENQSGYLDTQIGVSDKPSNPCRARNRIRKTVSSLRSDPIERSFVVARLQMRRLSATSAGPACRPGGKSPYTRIESQLRPTTPLDTSGVVCLLTPLTLSGCSDCGNSGSPAPSDSAAACGPKLRGRCCLPNNRTHEPSTAPPL